MKFPTLFLVIFLFQSNWGAESLVPPVKDGFYNATDLDGLSTSLRVGGDKRDVSWIAYDWSPFTETPSVALLLLYVKEVRSHGVLNVSLLEKTPDLENQTREVNYGASSIDTVSLNSNHEETLIAIDVTTAVNTNGFQGVVLTAGGSLDASFGSKESGNRPLIMVRTSVSGGPTGPAGGALSGTYPDPALAASSVGSDELEDGSVTDNKITGVDYGKVLNHPTAYPPTAHDHAGDALTPLSLLTGSIQAGDTSAPKIGMITWTFQTTNSPASLWTLDRTGSNKMECPNPDGIIHLSGTLTSDVKVIPPGITETNNDYWDVQYENNSNFDALRLNHPMSTTQGKEVTVFAIYRIP